jgi:hypothetical protein
MSLQLSHQPTLNPIQQIQKSVINLENNKANSILPSQKPIGKLIKSKSVSKFIKKPNYDPTLSCSPLKDKKQHPAFNVGTLSNRGSVKNVIRISILILPE